MMSEELEDEFFQSGDAEEGRAQSRNQDARPKTALTISIGMANPKRKFPEAWSEFLPDSLRLCTTSQLITLHGAKQGPENHHQRGPGALAVRYGRWLVVLSGVCRVLERPKENF